jgi:elongator complex protein 1
MEENYQKFKIDDFLKKYEKAISHLSKCNEKQDELISYMNKHKLYRKCLELYSSSSPIYNIILKSFGNYQYSIREFGQSGMCKSKSYYNILIF